MKIKWELGLEGGLVIANPVLREDAMDEIVIEDEAAALKELQDLGQLGRKCIKTTQSLLKSEVKKLLIEYGPDLEYVKIAEGKESLSIIKKY